MKVWRVWFDADHCVTIAAVSAGEARRLAMLLVASEEWPALVEEAHV